MGDATANQELNTFAQGLTCGSMAGERLIMDAEAIEALIVER